MVLTVAPAERELRALFHSVVLVAGFLLGWAATRTFAPLGTPPA